MKISGFGEQETGAWDALHKGTERESFDSPSRFDMSTLGVRLPHRQPRPAAPPPARPVPPPASRAAQAPAPVAPRPVAPVLPPPAPVREESWDDGYEWVEDGESGYWEEPAPAASAGQPAVRDPYSFDEYAGSPGPEDRAVPEGSAYQRRPADEERRSRHALEDPYETDRFSAESRNAYAEERYADGEPAAGASDLDQFWSGTESEPVPEPVRPEPPTQPTKSRVRPYARTRGRTRSDHNLALEALVSTSDEGRRYRGVRSIEHRRICDLCLETRSVAEIAAHLHLPLGVVKVLVGDMADIGLVLLHQTELILGDRSSREFMERVLQGLRRL
ncbi:DUF742 domain-containing protein [Amycolatopsis benzoatilytica]|uniref:DUF742 domain-containing protein n=1 Tax=Amycolatopsis benzoatilytica TaxID=346045 RepID=UPI00037384C1|nr:DUF742 domain-containing protein [Amycolatopsis benzoatilytica]